MKWTVLIHSGVKGQKWGVRRYQNPDGSLTPAGKVHYRKMGKLAKKDAKETARAQMFYGQGAGNRRKLIKAKVEENSKDPMYKEQYEKYLRSQDMGKHADKAKTERHMKDAKQQGAKIARGMYHLSVGDAANVSMGAAAAYKALKYLH